MKTVSEGKRYEELDALRGIAALMVVFFHFTLGRKEAESGFNLGITGVNLFFMISGFVIFMSINKIKKSSEFVINRVSRLYPTYWACVSITFITKSVFVIYVNKPLSTISLTDFLGNLTMFQYYLGIQDLDGPYWTMIIEMIFYISILILFHFKLLKHITSAGIILCILTLLSTQYFFNTIIIKNILNFFPIIVYLPLFFAGIIFFKIYTETTNRVFHYAILLLCLICQIALYDYIERFQPHVSFVEYSIMLIVFFILFTLFVFNKLKFLVNNTTLFLGKISFSLYLIHQFITLSLILPLLVNKYNINFWIASFCLTLPLLILIASLITFYIEIPLRKIFKAKLYSFQLQKHI